MHRHEHYFPVYNFRPPFLELCSVSAVCTCYCCCEMYSAKKLEAPCGTKCGFGEENNPRPLGRVQQHQEFFVNYLKK